ncbi:GNAT family N-acetyltransferase [Streptomyces yaizuensis]|uniref:GNAT family N-acetyltransferase n=1 Tax=Streptomyces yaizuensis TaxID=2989713 RepID=A0ABQ5NX54_9ACTN|nr:GNAT family N-acetyltransferase [Streptomyces sp. YSPA8]GLF94950.1 GNAT family N-acetyltransferase [Streptomyces sp. YSPA8]
MSTAMSTAMTSETADSGLRLTHATTRDAERLYRLSRPFVRSGALRERTLERYARDAGDFLLATSGDGALAGCVALRRHPPYGTTACPGRPAVLYNFCVTGGGQGRGVGSALLTAVLAEALELSVTVVYTATTGDGRLFLRHGFTVGDGSGAPAEWLAALDPSRGSRILSRTLPGMD